MRTFHQFVEADSDNNKSKPAENNVTDKDKSKGNGKNDPNAEPSLSDFESTTRELPMGTVLEVRQRPEPETKIGRAHV